MLLACKTLATNGRGMTDIPPPGYSGGSILPSPAVETPILRVQGGGGMPIGYSSASILPQPVKRQPLLRIVGGGGAGAEGAGGADEKGGNIEGIEFRGKRGDAAFQAATDKSELSQLYILEKRPESATELPKQLPPQFEEVNFDDLQQSIFIDEDGAPLNLKGEYLSTKKILPVLRLPSASSYTFARKALEPFRILRNLKHFPAPTVPVRPTTPKGAAPADMSKSVEFKNGSVDLDGITLIQTPVGKTILVGRSLLRVRNPTEKGVKEDIAVLRFTPSEFQLFIQLGFNKPYIKTYLKQLSTQSKEANPFTQFWEQYILSDCGKIEHYYTKTECLATEKFLKTLYDEVFRFRREEELQFLLGKKPRAYFTLGSGKLEVPRSADSSSTAAAGSAARAPVVGQVVSAEKEEEVAVLSAVAVHEETSGGTSDKGGDREDDQTIRIDESMIDGDLVRLEEKNGKQIPIRYGFPKDHIPKLASFFILPELKGDKDIENNPLWKTARDALLTEINRITRVRLEMGSRLRPSRESPNFNLTSLSSIRNIEVIKKLNSKEEKGEKIESIIKKIIYEYIPLFPKGDIVPVKGGGAGSGAGSAKAIHGGRGTRRKRHIQ